MGVKHIVCENGKVLDQCNLLIGAGYNSIRIFLKGSKEHEAKGLDPEHALIRAWKGAPGPKKEA
jgi:hypothetical protein